MTTGSAPPALEFSGATVEFGTGRLRLRAVDGVDLTVPPGTIVGLVGESGSGKSTLAKSAVGLVSLTSGSVAVDGRDAAVRRRRKPARSIQMVFQDPYSSLDPRMTIGESITEALPRGTSPAARREEVRRLLSLVHLDSDRSAVLPAELSGGQRQRVALARALAARPHVVIADEMTSALDVSVQGAMLNLVREVQRELGLSVLFISHNLSVVRYVSDIVAVMYLGRIVEQAPTLDLLTTPRHPYTRTLLESVPRLGVPLRETSLDPTVRQVMAEDPPDPHHPPAGCRFHPRCPVGPRVYPERTVCREQDPTKTAGERPHLAACHFAQSGTQAETAS